jgi:hypothetical protein
MTHASGPARGAQSTSISPLARERSNTTHSRLKDASDVYPLFTGFKGLNISHRGMHFCSCLLVCGLFPNSQGHWPSCTRIVILAPRAYSKPSAGGALSWEHVRDRIVEVLHQTKPGYGSISSIQVQKRILPGVLDVLKTSNVGCESSYLSCCY